MNRRSRHPASELGWLASNPGRRLLSDEVPAVQQALDSVFGDQLLQLGAWGAEQFPQHARTRRVAVLADAPAPGVGLVCALDQLAIATDSIDAVLLAHVLETHEAPHELLREVDRILRPDGHVAILAFNPAGFWGLRHLASRRRFPAGVRHLFLESRLRDWLRLLGFSVQHAAYYHYQQPFWSSGSAGDGTAPAPGTLTAPHADVAGTDAAQDAPAPGPVSLAFRQIWGRARRWPPFAGCYVLVARKEMFTITPIRPRWQRQRRLVGGLVNPTTRNAA